MIPNLRLPLFTCSLLFSGEFAGLKSGATVAIVARLHFSVDNQAKATCPHCSLAVKMRLAARRCGDFGASPHILYIC